MRAKEETVAWNNSHIYSGFNDIKIESDIAHIEAGCDRLKKEAVLFDRLISEGKTETYSEELQKTIPFTQELFRLLQDLYPQLQTINTFASIAVSVNGEDQIAKDLQTRMERLGVDLQKAAAPLNVFLLRVPDEYLKEFLLSPKINEMSFSLEHSRKESDFLLSISEENLLTGHSMDGLYAWGKLYNELSSAIKLEVQGKTMGLAEASNLLTNESRALREEAYTAINNAWKTHEISSCAILNAINGWRIENDKARSKKRTRHFLDKSCHQSRIQKETLDALISATHKERDVAHSAHRIMASEMKISKMAPWDIAAPFPENTPERHIPFTEGMEIITHSFNQLCPDFGEFATMMSKNNWIDAGPSLNRRQGAYCTNFATHREPRVFMTYQGSMNNVLTLAHELGHAYHNWVMRDLRLGESRYAMTLAETASIFAETLVRDTLVKQAATKKEKKKLLWQEAMSASTFLLNIPARFAFEKKFVELRNSKFVSVKETKSLMSSAWEEWYGDSLSEYNEMFWASKLHFSMAHFGFYNYPYLFGYLFSLGIYAKKEEQGAGFAENYKNLLKDTGMMTAEDLVKKHFNQDITQEDFWRKSIRIVEKSLKQFEEL